MLHGSVVIEIVRLSETTKYRKSADEITEVDTGIEQKHNVLYLAEIESMKYF